jgi:hypothetical protein
MFSESQMLNTFALDASTCAKGKHFSALRLRGGGVKIALVTGLALASIGLTAGEAHAVVVNVGGQDYDVTTFTGTFLDNISKFQTPANGGVMPWWTTGPEGTYATAVQFAAAVGNALGAPNFSDPAEGPFFAWNQYIYTPDPQTALAAVYWNPPSSSVTGFNFGWADSWVYAQATLLTSPAAPVPGPLPALGAAAAFGFSRKLRKRINRSAKTVPSTYSL